MFPESFRSLSGTGQTVQPGPVFLQPRSPGQIVSPLLQQVAVILSPVVKAAPALIDPLYVMAQVKYLSGEPASVHLFSHPPGGRSPLPRAVYTDTHPLTRPGHTPGLHSPETGLTSLTSRGLSHPPGYWRLPRSERGTAAEAAELQFRTGAAPIPGSTRSSG